MATPEITQGAIGVEGTEQNPIETPRQKFVDFLKKENVEYTGGTRLATFACYTRYQDAYAKDLAEPHYTRRNLSLAERKIESQLDNGISLDNFKFAWGKFSEFSSAYYKEVTQGISTPADKQRKFADSLAEIRDQEMARRSSHPQTPPQK